MREREAYWLKWGSISSMRLRKEEEEHRLASSPQQNGRWKKRERITNMKCRWSGQTNMVGVTWPPSLMGSCRKRYHSPHPMQITWPDRKGQVQTNVKLKTRPDAFVGWNYGPPDGWHGFSFLTLTKARWAFPLNLALEVVLSTTHDWSTQTNPTDA